MTNRFRLAGLCALALAALAFTAPAAQAEPLAPVSISAVPTYTKAPLHAPANTAPLSLLAAVGAIGATANAKSRKLNLSQSYLFNGETFGPGNDVEVPADFPDIDGESGLPIHPEGSVAARNARASARANGQAPLQVGPASTGPVGTGRTVSGLSADELEGMTRDDLKGLAEKAGIVVVREDGTDGAPLKSDFVAALSATETAS